jgi:hypothetical protein
MKVRILKENILKVKLVLWAICFFACVIGVGMNAPITEDSGILANIFMYGYAILGGMAPVAVSRLAVIQHFGSYYDENDIVEFEV